MILLRTGFGPVHLRDIEVLILVLIFRLPSLILVLRLIVILRKKGLGGVVLRLLV